ncbi:AraC family transcriptional regulator [Saccharomonospora sp. NPDC006951]
MSGNPATGHWGGRLSWSPGRLTYVGSGGPADVHRHHAVQLVVSYDGCFELDVEGRTSRPRAAVIPSGARHSVDTSGRHIALVLIEPSGDGIARRAAELAGRELAVSSETPPERPELIPAFTDRLLRIARLSPGRSAGRPLSPPVAAAVDYLDLALRGRRRPSLREAARAAHLSESRLTHVFSAEVGLPFRRFVLWLRLRHAARALAEVDTLTEAAVVAGFSDLAHFSRVCRETFGVNPSAVTRMELAADDRRAAATFKPSGGGA